MTSMDKVLGRLEAGMDFLKDQVNDMRKNNKDFKDKFERHMENEERELKGVVNAMNKNHLEVKKDIFEIKVDVVKLENQSVIGIIKKIWGVVKK